MRLELGRIYVKDIQFGSETKISNGLLTVNKDELAALIKEDERITDVKLDIARPGERVRIIPVKDVIEPRIKVGSRQKGFPGVTAGMHRVGLGRTNVLYGAAVVTIGDIVGMQEGIIDMFGEGAKWTPFSKTFNLVVDLTPAPGLEPHSHETAVRLAGLKASTYLAQCAEAMEAEEVIAYEMDNMAENIKKYPDLPKIVYAEMLISQGLLHDGFIYGVNSKEILPTLIHPNEELDGAVISGNCVAACDKITTYQHQNNSVIQDLYAKHGKELNFLGVILVPELTTLEGKFRSCEMTANLAKMLGADGVIVSEEGYGNPDSDLLIICKKLEQEGITTVLITDECSGQDGFSQPLADTTPEAKAVISAGNVSHLVKLDKADVILGNEAAIENVSGGWHGSQQEDGRLFCELNAVIGATSEIGFHYATTVLR